MDLILPVLIISSILLVLWLLSIVARMFTRSTNNHLPIRDIDKGHHWVVVEAFPPGHYCNVCQMSTFHGFECDFCGIIVDDGCIRKAGNIKCKTLAIDEHKSLKHHWVAGNLPHRSVCSVCDEVCGDGPGLRDLRCCWCQSTVHSNCCNSLTAICDLGPFKRMIVPPNCVLLKKVGWKGRRHYVVDRVLRPSIADWSPLIVVANRKSGNGEGELVLQSFRRILNPAQVFDLSQVSPEAGLRWCTLLADAQCRVLVAGGDGSVGWILSTVERLQLNPPPLIGLLPLGTGNDLSRVLGWGSGHFGSIDTAGILNELAMATPVRLDRWNVTVRPRRQFGLRAKDKLLQMSNYYSVGVDAAVTLNFHERRNTLPHALSSRFINKMLFFHYGTRDVVERVCRNLHQDLELYLDGTKVDLPQLEGIVLLNIPCWGAGVRPWSLGSRNNGHLIQKQKIDDGLLEVFGLYSSFHIAQLQVGLSEPLRLGQAREVLIRIFQGRYPMQVDGEPWTQGPCTITIKCKGQACMLAKGDTIESPHMSPVPGDRVSFF